MTAVLEALPRNTEVCLRRRGDVDDVGSGVSQERGEIGAVHPCREALRELLSHERLAVADADQVSAEADDLGCVGVRNPATPDNRRFEHLAPLLCEHAATREVAHQAGAGGYMRGPARSLLQSSVSVAGVFPVDVPHPAIEDGRYLLV